MRGFTLLETAVSSFLLSLVVLAAFGLVPGSSLAVQRAGCQFQARSLGEHCLERARSAGFSSLQAGSTSEIYNLDGVDYTLTREVFAPGADAATLKGIRARVDWSYHGKSHRLEQETWICAVRN